MSKVLQKLEVDVYSESFCGQKYDKDRHICMGAEIGSVCSVRNNIILLTINFSKFGHQ